MSKIELATRKMNKLFEQDLSKYHATPDNLKDVLKENGFAIIPNVLNEQECIEMENGIWDYLEYLSSKHSNKINRNDSSSWTNLKDFFPKHSMLLQHFGVGHTEISWKIRQNPKIVSIFAKLWNVDETELLTSFDGMSAHLQNKTGFYRGNNWPHIDQLPIDYSDTSYQSWVTARDVNAGDATLYVLRNSHKYLKQFQEKFQNQVDGDWFQLESKHVDWYLSQPDCEEIVIKCPKGSMVFWDSKSVHHGIEALRDRKEHNFRFIIYLCYTPRHFADNVFDKKTGCFKKNLKNRDIILKKRIKAFNECRTSSHKPHAIKLFPKIPRTYGANLPELPTFTTVDIKLTPLGKKLIGF